MEDAFNLPVPDNKPPATEPEQKAQAPVGSHRSVAEALAYLNELKSRAMSYVGKDNMNPYLWLEQRGINALIKRLSAEQHTTQDVEAAFTIQFEEPNINLFSVLYEAKRPESKSHGV